MNTANFVTLSRAALTPFFLICLIYEQFFTAFLLFTACIATDLADGIVARVGNQKTTLGTLLDPLADKLLLIPAYITLAFMGAIPKWIFILMIFRDFAILTGWLFYAIHDRNFQTHPRPLGKTTIAVQMIWLFAVLGSQAFPGGEGSLFSRSAGIAVLMAAALTFLSFMDYLIFGSAQLTASLESAKKRK